MIAGSAMSTIEVQSTGDIPLAILKHTFETEDGVANVDECQFFARSADPPSWISLIANLKLWQQVLGAGLTVYASAILAEAGKDTWRHKSKIGDAVRRGALSLAQLAEKIVTLQSLVPPHTRFIVGLPLADRHELAAMTLSAKTSGEIEGEMALFCMHAPALERALENDSVDPIGQVSLSLTQEGNLIVRWMDRNALDIRELRLDRQNSS
jgi:hypothetical protein